MNAHCPRCLPLTLMIYQPATRGYYCPKCHLKFTPREVRVIDGGKKDAAN
jgi:hypothetical protein